MAVTEGTHLTDFVIAQLVDEVPEAQAPAAPRPTPTDPPNPVSIARDATVSQTGADPPPGVRP